MRRVLLSIITILNIQVVGNAESFVFDVDLEFPRTPYALNLSGTIDSTLGIHMQLYRDGQQLEGSYSYERYQENIALTGTLTQEGQITLAEYGNAQHPELLTGTFDGRFVSPNQIEGRWRDPSHGRDYPFVLERAPVVLLTGMYDKRIPFQVRAEPLYQETRWALDEIVFELQDTGEIPLTQQEFWQSWCDKTDGGVDVESFQVHRLSGSPALIKITWSTRPIARTLGESCLVIIAEAQPVIRLFDGCLGSSMTQSDFDVWEYAHVTYSHNTLSVTTSHSYREFSPETDITESGVEEIVCSYNVYQDGLVFLHVQGRQQHEQYTSATDGREYETELPWQSLHDLQQEDCMYGALIRRHE